MKATVLNNNLFDDGSIDCYNFWLADCDGVQQVDVSLIRGLGIEQDVQAAIDSGKSYYAPKELVYAGVAILEVQWG